MSLSDRVLRVGASIAKTRAAKKKYKQLRKAFHFRCELCGVDLNSRESRKSHEEGRAHKRAIEKKRDGKLECLLCNKVLRTRKEFEQHLVSKRHLKLIEVEKSREKQREEDDAWKQRRHEHRLKTGWYSK